MNVKMRKKKTVEACVKNIRVVEMLLIDFVATFQVFMSFLAIGVS